MNNKEKRRTDWSCVAGALLDRQGRTGYLSAILSGESTMFPTITGRKIRNAIIGCGRISKNHFGAIEKHQDNMELVAVCDSDPAVLRDHAERYGVPGFSSLTELLDKSDCDLVTICTPSGLHPRWSSRRPVPGVMS